MLHNKLTPCRISTSHWSSPLPPSALVPAREERPFHLLFSFEAESAEHFSVVGPTQGPALTSSIHPGRRWPAHTTGRLSRRAESHSRAPQGPRSSESRRAGELRHPLPSLSGVPLSPLGRRPASTDPGRPRPRVAFLVVAPPPRTSAAQQPPPAPARPPLNGLNAQPPSTRQLRAAGASVCSARRP
ncbi:hypothetical protein NDU88_001526 [Pleurodeles waltl]|uniref:Uncharacterized protein n=1 Tax=Pleurodeles waltl TaxID=8319 RepID=A0AAV7W0R6_PLEWA|nr:hypothetical protein NDU88_001526 [Pleurodeles waltl]